MKVRVRGKHPHVYRESETATIARYSNLSPPVFENGVWKILGRKDKVVRILFRAAALTYLKGRRDQYYREMQLGYFDYPSMRLVKVGRDWEVREPQLDMPLFMGTWTMCEWYLLGREDEWRKL